MGTGHFHEGLSGGKHTLEIIIYNSLALSVNAHPQNEERSKKSSNLRYIDIIPQKESSMIYLIQ